VLARTVERLAAESEVTLRGDDATVLAATLPFWPRFPDTVEGLSQLRDDGWRLAILSNVDPDLIAGTLDRLTVPIDLVVTAADVRSYKPGAAHFERFVQEAAPPAEGWVHAANDHACDVVPAARLGARTAWVNREHRVRPAGSPAALETSDLRTLVARLAREG
jgi:2-haloacid dehalogenase